MTFHPLNSLVYTLFSNWTEPQSSPGINRCASPGTNSLTPVGYFFPPHPLSDLSTRISIFTDRFAGFTEKTATEAYFHYFDVYIRYSFELNIFERTQDYE